MVTTQKQIDLAVSESVEIIRRATEARPEVAVVLGTGTGDFTSFIKHPAVIPFAEIPHFGRTTVEGHPGNLVCGKFEDMEVAVCAGRFHYYEGYSMHEVAYPVRVLSALGAKALVLINAAGGIKRDMQVGDLMILGDYINVMGDSPLRGILTDPPSAKFTPMNRPFDDELTDIAFRSAVRRGFRVHRGTYVAVHGPSYETDAELQFFHVIGGDAVGMSTVPEVIIARHLGMRCMAISVITNLTFGADSVHVSHKQVLETARGSLSALREVFKDILVAI